jgi:hypothetical protein
MQMTINKSFFDVSRVQRWYDDTECQTRPCAPWKCTCQGLSNLYWISPRDYGLAPPIARNWWAAMECQVRYVNLEGDTSQHHATYWFVFHDMCSLFRQKEAHCRTI